MNDIWIDDDLRLILCELARRLFRQKEDDKSRHLFRQKEDDKLIYGRTRIVKELRAMGKDQWVLDVLPSAVLLKEKAATLLDLLLDYSSLLVRDGLMESHFVHLTVQEYLVACALRERVKAYAQQLNDPAIRASALKRIDWNNNDPKAVGNQLRLLDYEEFIQWMDQKAWLSQWHEVFLFLSGVLALDESTCCIVPEFLSDPSRDDEFRHRMALAAECVAEAWEVALANGATP